MKKLFLMLIATLSFSYAMAQAEMDFPFQGGHKVMADYFTNHITVTDVIKQRAASGLVVLKFTSDDKGSVIKIVVYYADDASLAEPVIKAMQGTSGKWIIPDKQKSYDFLIPFSITIDKPAKAAAGALLKFYNNRSPIVAVDQIPLNTVSLLPVVNIKYPFVVPETVR